MNDIVYFELNNWFAGEDYPDAEPFLSWLIDDSNQAFRNEKWVKENRLCVVFTPIDMSQNYCITATKDWVLKNCPDLLNDKEFKQFLRFPDEDGNVYSEFGMEFLPYEEENFGVMEVYDDDYYEEEEEE